MAPKGATCFLLFFVAFTVLAQPPSDRKKRDFKSLTKKLINRCQEKGYPMPQTTLLKTIFSNSKPMEDREGDPSEFLLNSFLKVMNPARVGKNKSPGSQLPMDVSDKMKNKMINGTYLAAMVKRMRDATEGENSSICYMRAFFAPRCWAAFIRQPESELNSNASELLLWASKPLLEESPSARMSLPPKVDLRKMKDLLGWLRKSYISSSDSERSSVAKWILEQIYQNRRNFTLRQPSDSLEGQKNGDKPSRKCLSSDEFKLMGSYSLYLPPHEVDCLSNKTMCGLFRSGWFKSMIASAKPSVCNKFVRKHKECFGGKFPEQLDKLGPLVCCLDSLPKLSPNLSTKVLLQLEPCQKPSMKNIKRGLFNSLTSNPSKFQGFGWPDVNCLYSYFSNPDNTLKELLKNKAQNWTENQQCVLVKKKLGDKCNNVSYKELTEDRSLAKALPICKIKLLQPKEMLENIGVLKNIIKEMRKGPLKAVVQKLRKNPGMLPDPLFCHLSLSTLKKMSISLDQMKNKTWRRSQALFLVEKWLNQTRLNFRTMRSLLRGVTCERIEKSANIEDFAQVVKENPQLVSKHQVRCAARLYFANLEKERKDYFKTITEEELDNITTPFLLHLPPSKVMDLPDSVCDTFLDKMEEANLSWVPLRYWSRRALIDKSLSCLENGGDLSQLTTAKLYQLKPLICDLPPTKMRLMNPEVRNKSLEMMASCCRILPRHIAPLNQLLKETFGDPSGWEPETVETLGRLLFLDDEAAPDVPKKPLMKAAIQFLMSACPAKALKKKYFELVTADSANTMEGSSEVNNQGETIITPNLIMIEELGEDNYLWPKESLELISKDTFMATAETLGASSNWDADQLPVLSKIATESFGPVSQMRECQLMQIGCITRGFSDSELEKLPFSLDTVEQQNHCGWSESQMKWVWKGVAKRFNLTAQKLAAEDFVSLNQFICCLDSDEIQQLNIDAFMDAVGSMERIKCSLEKMQSLTKRAVSTFGDPKFWSEADISDFGDFVAGFTNKQLGSLSTSVFPYISPFSIPQIHPNTFKVLSQDQLRALGSDNAAMVTLAQRAQLSESQLAALEEAETGAQRQAVPNEESGGSGAPSPSVEGLSAFMKPLMFLFMGFLLL